MTTSRQAPRRTAPPTADATMMMSSKESESDTVLGDSVVVFTNVFVVVVVSMGGDVLAMGSSHSLSLYVVL